MRSFCWASRMWSMMTPTSLMLKCISFILLGFVRIFIMIFRVRFFLLNITMTNSATISASLYYFAIKLKLSIKKNIENYPDLCLISNSFSLPDSLFLEYLWLSMLFIDSASGLICFFVKSLLSFKSKSPNRHCILFI